MRAGGFHHDAKVQHPLGRQRRVRDRGRRPEGARRRRRGLRARRLRRPRHRGQARRPEVGPREAGAHPRASASGLQCMVIEYARNVAGIADASLHASSTPSTPAPGHRDDGGAEGLRRGRRRPRRHHAPRLLPGQARPRARCVAEAYGATAVERAAPPPLRGQQRLPRRSSRRPACVFSGTSPGRHARRVRRAARRRAPVLRLDAGAPGVPVAPAPGAPAVRGPGRGRDRRASGRPGSSRSSARRRAETVSRAVTLGAPTGARRGAGRPARATPGRAQRDGSSRAWSGTSSATRVDLGEGGDGHAASTSSTPAPWRSWRWTTVTGCC